MIDQVRQHLRTKAPKGQHTVAQLRAALDEAERIEAELEQQRKRLKAERTQAVLAGGEARERNRAELAAVEQQIEELAELTETIGGLMPAAEKREVENQAMQKLERMRELLRVAERAKASYGEHAAAVAQALGELRDVDAEYRHLASLVRQESPGLFDRFDREHGGRGDAGAPSATECFGSLTGKARGANRSGYAVELPALTGREPYWGTPSLIDTSPVQ